MSEEPISEAQQADVEDNEEYAYLERGGFSSEKFKIELRGLPKFYGIAVSILTSFNFPNERRPR